MNRNIMMICALSYTSSLWSSVGPAGISLACFPILEQCLHIRGEMSTGTERSPCLVLAGLVSILGHPVEICHFHAVFSGTCEIGGYKFPFRACRDVLFLLLK